jgi:hypothetical protein
MTHQVIDMEVISTLSDEVLTTKTKCSRHPDFIMDWLFASQTGPIFLVHQASL